MDGCKQFVQALPYVGTMCGGLCEPLSSEPGWFFLQGGKKAKKGANGAQPKQTEQVNQLQDEL